MMHNLPWLFLLLPLIVAALDWVCFHRCPRTAATLSILSALATLALCVAMLCGWQCCTPPDAYEWVTTTKFSLSLGLVLDDMALRMMLVVTGIGLLVHIFSLGYMKGDSSNLSRYFAGLSIFMFSMSTIVLADNLAMTFIGWEMVGFSSYLLIGHWFHKDSAADAAKKAFITNRVGDFGFLIGILLTLGVFGTLSFADMAGKAAAAPQAVLTAVVLCLFCGAVGKSAQFPLHVWLPDAMEGPTPVSALIHAATMVAAGVYMLVRLQVSMGAEAFTDTACCVISLIGGLTALLAALMALQQDDIKRVLAYSTLSQLGYMVMAVGLLAGEAAMFHLYTHAWFKALLFLGAGAIIICCHHEQNIWKMGGLSKRMPLTVLCFLMGTCALIAIPGFSGFFSKEAILDAAWEKSLPCFVVGVSVAALTTFYMVRLCLVAFCGKGRSHSAEGAREAGATMLLPLVVLGVLAIISGYGFVADRLVPCGGFHAHGLEIGVPFFAGLGALLVGGGAAWWVYGRKSCAEDPLAGNAFSRALRKRLYIDCFYDCYLVGFVQKYLACTLDFIDDGLLRRLVVQGSARLTGWVGRLAGSIQNGSLRYYTLITGLGLLFIIFLLAFTIQF
ncbi:MAG: NADH-quinone oxidoreductase subunit L [Akkermansiaceae bacterium]|nr:NADH-quinone oxidoreductase subunit L [Akkermansiaceae bacterium]